MDLVKREHKAFCTLACSHLKILHDSATSLQCTLNLCKYDALPSVMHMCISHPNSASAAIANAQPPAAKPLTNTQPPPTPYSRPTSLFPRRRMMFFDIFLWRACLITTHRRTSQFSDSTPLIRLRHALRSCRAWMLPCAYPHSDESTP